MKKYVDEASLQQNIEETKEYVRTHGGHTILNSDGVVLESKTKLKFEGTNVSNEGDTTVVEPQVVTIETETEWNSMTEAEKNDPNKVYLLPFKNITVDAVVGSIITVSTAVEDWYGKEVTVSDSVRSMSDFLDGSGNLTMNGVDMVGTLTFSLSDVEVTWTLAAPYFGRYEITLTRS